jgi:phosphoglycolate phosphatase-like HAD superfamily hydrolase
MATEVNAPSIKLRLGGELRAIRLLVFDCDGVLLDTMSAKIAAFRQWVTHRWPEHEAVFLNHVMGSFGRSRVFQIEWFFNHCLKQVPDAATLSAEVERFTDICEPLCAEAGWLSGSSEFVAACEAAGVPCYVLSGTPQLHLEQMLAANGGNGRFRAIIGSPPAKPQSLATILSKEGVAAQQTVFVGDAEADAEAAESVGAHFVYKPSAAKRPGLRIVNEVTDLRELLAPRSID